MPRLRDVTRWAIDDALTKHKHGPVLRWFRTYGIIITLYYSLGAVLFHYAEGFRWFDCLYFMTVVRDGSNLAYRILSSIYNHIFSHRLPSMCCTTDCHNGWLW